jgi:nicotinamidase-related amidase
MAESFSPFSGAMLMCIDLQAVFLKSIPEHEQLLKRCSFAIQAAKGFGMPVVFTEQVPQKLGASLDEMLKLAPGAKQFGKTTFSALADDGIRDAVRAVDVEHLILCGLETSVCVYQTALDALDAQLQVTILSDAVAARRPEDAKVCLDALRARNHVFVLPSETVFYSMLADVKHPFFKAYTQLIKDHA